VTGQLALSMLVAIGGVGDQGLKVHVDGASLPTVGATRPVTIELSNPGSTALTVAPYCEIHLEGSGTGFYAPFDFDGQRVFVRRGPDSKNRKPMELPQLELGPGAFRRIRIDLLNVRWAKTIWSGFPNGQLRSLVPEGHYEAFVTCGDRRSNAVDLAVYFP
jgi:hypothetical protein